MGDRSQTKVYFHWKNTLIEVITWISQILIDSIFICDLSLVAQWWRTHLPMQETQVRFLGREDPLEEEMATHSIILAWKIPWAEKPGELQSIESQRVWPDLSNWAAAVSICI